MQKAPNDLSVPVALFIFKRPELTERVFAVIAQAQPRQLFVIADGPRTPDEAPLCERTRAILNKVNWDCEVFTNFSDRNLSCGIRVGTGLDWVFSQVEEAIILEDDCVPVPSFFPFCQQLLEHYRQEERVMHISGNNFQRGCNVTSYSYYFSKYSFSWGWATWRRAWQRFDYRIRSWPDFEKSRRFRKLCPDRIERAYWKGVFDHVYRGVDDIWDAQWLFTCWHWNGLAAIPSVNLVSNIGFGPQATHTFIETSAAAVPVEEMNDILHPPIIDRNRKADEYAFDTVYNGQHLRREQSLKARLRRRLYPWKQHVLSWLRK